MTILVELQAYKRDDWHVLTSDQCYGLYLAGPDIDVLLANAPLVISTLWQLNKERLVAADEIDISVSHIEPPRFA